jgi:hypothetical protein
MNVRSFQFFFIFLIIFGFYGVCFSSPTTLGPRITVAAGADPDITVDSEQSLHVVYVRGGLTYYRKIEYPYESLKFGPELYVGSGINPQVAVDSKNNPHVVFGRARYAYLSNGTFVEAKQAFSGWRKNLIAVDSQDRVYIIGDRNYPRGVLLRVYQNGLPLTNATSVGGDDPGGVGVGFDDTLHITWRDGSTYYNTYKFNGGGKGPSKRFSKSSGDFSWCSVDPKSGAIHVVYTAAYAKGLYHISKRNGSWTTGLSFGYNQVIQHEPDDVNPVSSNDSQGLTYITFRGRRAIGYFVVLDENDQLVGGFNKIDPQYNSHPGGKMTNPNIASHPDFSGAYVAWGTHQVYVRSIGNITKPHNGAAISSVVMDILLNQKNAKKSD